MDIHASCQEYVVLANLDMNAILHKKVKRERKKKKKKKEIKIFVHKDI